MLGLAELQLLVKRAFARGFIDSELLTLRDFEENLRRASDDPVAALRQPRGEYALFGDAIEELSA
jgi:hypothetical protein